MGPTIHHSADCSCSQCVGCESCDQLKAEVERLKAANHERYVAGVTTGEVMRKALGDKLTEIRNLVGELVAWLDLFRSDTRHSYEPGKLYDLLKRARAVLGSEVKP